MRSIFLYILFIFVISFSSVSRAEENSFNFKQLRDEVLTKLNQTETEKIAISELKIISESSGSKADFDKLSNLEIEDSFKMSEFTENQEKLSFSGRISSPEKSFKFEGKFNKTSEALVLSRTVKKGETITESDLKLVDLSRDKIFENAIKDKEDLIGKTAQKLIPQNKQILPTDVKFETIVKKGAVVTVIFKNQSMEIKTVAQAIQNGTFGQIIKLKNLSSGKIIEAKLGKDGIARVNFDENKNSNLASM
jgi:flagella basal body P-ring formation protein FlgA